MLLSDVHFGEVGKEVDWRKILGNSPDFDDDEELSETPESVISILGFDPKELDELAKGGPGSGNHTNHPPHNHQGEDPEEKKSRLDRLRDRVAGVARYYTSVVTPVKDAIQATTDAIEAGKRLHSHLPRRTEPAVAKFAESLLEKDSGSPQPPKIDIYFQHPDVETAQAAMQAVMERLFEKQKQIAVQAVRDWASSKKVAKNHSLQGSTTFQDLPIAIENGVGSTRSGTDKNGKSWSVTITYPYGYIKGTEGVDGDEVDVFIGPNPDAENVYVIHTTDKSAGLYGLYDEDKCMLGWNSPEEATKAFLENYTDTSFFRSIETMPMAEFKEKLSSLEGKKLSIVEKFASKLTKVDPDLDTTQREALIASIEALVGDTWKDLPQDVQDYLLQSVQAGTDKGIGELAISESSLINDVNSIGANQARARSAEMVGMKYNADGDLIPNPNAEWVISDTTRDEIRALVTKSFEEQTDVRDLAQTLQDSFAFSPARAENIAITEIKNAAVEGNWNVWKNSGAVEQVSFLNSEDPNVCEICENLAKGSPYDFDECPHPVLNTHPRCRCSLVVTKMVGEEPMETIGKFAKFLLSKGGSRSGNF